MRIRRIWSGELTFPCPRCGKEVEKEDLRWLVERILLDANPEMLREMRAQRKGEEEDFSWLEELYAGKRFFICPACGGGIPEDLIRYVIDGVLAVANPELLVRVKARWKAEKGESVLKNFYFGEEYGFGCGHCHEPIRGEAVRRLIEQILEEANPGLLEELRTQWKAEGKKR
ncbi:MAG: hypothetical protein QW098_00660 [Candidatus Hadarchaeales archaeon]